MAPRCQRVMAGKKGKKASGPSGSWHKTVKETEEREERVKREECKGDRTLTRWREREREREHATLAVRSVPTHACPCSKI